MAGSVGRRVPECGHPGRQHKAKGLCGSCYALARWKNLATPRPLRRKPLRVTPSGEPQITVLMRVVPDDELRYLAGFFDADGTVGIYEVRRKDRPGVTRWALSMGVVGIHKDSIERYRRAFGGGIYPSVYKTKKNWRPTWQWKLNGPQARQALTQLLPFLNVKRGQAEDAIKYPFGWKNYPRQPELHAERERLALRIRAMKADMK